VIDEKRREMILDIAEKLKSIRWTLIGSTSRQLQGMDVSPNDIDISVHVDDLEKIREIFKEYNPPEVKELKTTTKERAWHVKFFLNDFEIEFLGEESNGLFLKKILDGRTSVVEGVPCMNLDAAAECLEATNREEKAKKIRKWLNDN